MDTLLTVPWASNKRDHKRILDQTYFDNFKHCKSHLLEIDMIISKDKNSRGSFQKHISLISPLSIFFRKVMSDVSFLRPVIMIEHIKIMQISHLDIWPMLLGQVPQQAATQVICFGISRTLSVC